MLCYFYLMLWLDSSKSKVHMNNDYLDTAAITITITTYCTPTPPLTLTLCLPLYQYLIELWVLLVKGALKRKSLNVEECGHEIRNEFHWSQNSRGTQAIIIVTQDRISYVAVTYDTPWLAS